MGNTPSVPPPGGQKPKPDIKPPKVKPKDIQPKSESLTGDSSLKYMGFTFSSQKDLETFRNKFLASMMNTMMAQMKKENDRMLKAIKKLNPNTPQ
ncbi:MAG: hypothetical protein K1060chlam1_00660 [Candidatus Anoxychlamydiales bacterium]|nr:hypothetical protein [Candidatus Anoxychlamydiales bacterium]